MVYSVEVERALNLICFLIAFASVSAWIVERVRSDSSLIPELDRGLLVVVCILMLLLPAISITDDLAQVPLLAECAKLQDVLKAPEQLVQFLVIAIFFSESFSAQTVVLWREARNSPGFLEKLVNWSPNIEKRPPPPRFTAEFIAPF